MSNKNDIEGIRHSLAHLLAQTVKEMWPGSLNAIGPTIDDGFYQDFELNGKISEDDLPKIEEAMRLKLKEWTHFDKKEVSLEEAEEIFQDNKYKVELAKEFAEGGKTLTVYTCGGFDDLCKGGHADDLSQIDPKSFKLTRTAGAYWRGDEKNIMLTRIYGVAFTTETELDEYLKRQEQARERDHKKLGKEMELFFFDETAPGMAYWMPRGMILRNVLLDFWRRYHREIGYHETASPLINKKELYETSGHWQHYHDDMFTSEREEGEWWGLKPMNCPNAMQFWKQKTRSYRDLPLRFSDTDMLHRDEITGALNGLLRARSFQQDDSHNFVSEEQIKDEIAQILKITEDFYGVFGVAGDVKLYLSTRPEKFMGDIETWGKAEAELKDCLEKSSFEWGLKDRDGAFYGPKIDIHLNDALGREWQCGTIQLDFQLPRNFGLTYSDKNGDHQTPVVIHRVLYGSIERFLGVYIESTGGHLPFWVAPEQVRVLTINDSVADYVEGITTILKDALLMEPLKYNELRYSVDGRNESLGKKIKEATELRIPVQLIVGPKDKEAGEVSVRTKDGESKIKLGELKEFLLNFK
jgi:threonyl-tRNA synthetase